MFISDIVLHEPESLDEVFAVLDAHPGETRLMAGGTDVLVDLKSGLRTCGHVVSLQKVGGLRFIEDRDGRLHIGAMSTLTDVLESGLVRRMFPALSETAATMASTQVRNLGTIGGNITSAVPSADSPPVLIAAGAEAVVAGAGGERTMPLAEYITGVRTTACGASEVLVRIQVPPQGPGTGASYHKYQLRESNALAVAGVAAWVRLDGDKVAECRIVLGAVSPTPVLAEKAAAHVVGRAPRDDDLREAGKIARDECVPISDVRGSAQYRRDLVEVLTRRALGNALIRARGGA